MLVGAFPLRVVWAFRSRRIPNESHSIEINSRGLVNYLKLYLLSVSLVLFEVGFGAFLEHFIDLRHDPLYSYKRLLTVILPKKGSGARKIGSFASSWRINATASPLGFPSFSGYRACSLPSPNLGFFSGMRAKSSIDREE